MTAQPRFDVACLGRAAVDLYGEQVGCGLEDVSTFARYLGGSPANTAVGVARLGLRSAMISRVGDEQNGRFVRATLEREGVDVSQVRTDPERLTALVFLAMRGADDFPHVFYRDRCADMGLVAGDIDAGFLAGCASLLVSGTHLSTPGTRAACTAAIAAMRAHRGRVILDIDYRPVLWGRAGHADGAGRDAPSAEATRAYQAILPECALVVGTEEELRVAGGSDDLDAALRAVRGLTHALIVVKRGPRGCVAYPGAIDAAAAVVVPGFPVDVFNTLGAGDAFMAGFLRGWLRDEPLGQCCRQGNACGALVVSRHGCAPAMPSWPELQHFLAHPVPRSVRHDATLEHLHRATTRAPLAAPLHILAFDHRTQLEAIAGGSDRIAQFKSLVARAFQRVSDAHPGTCGVIVDDRHGAHVLPPITAARAWVARPVESPGAVPLAFETGARLGTQLREWPASHVAKCLVAFAADDPPALRDAQVACLRELADVCAATSRELLLEVLPHPHTTRDAFCAGSALQALYRAGIKPAWWKLPPSTTRDAWSRVDEAIGQHDPWCRGVLVLGMEAAPERLRASFEAAAASPWVRGFAVGRSIFGAAAEAWFAGRIGDAAAIDDIATRYEEVIRLWTSVPRPPQAAPKAARTVTA